MLDFSPAAAEFRKETNQPQPNSDGQADAEDDQELSLSPELLTAFQNTLASYKINFKFTSGPWSHFTENTHSDLILTSETIYRSESHEDLIKIFRSPSSEGGVEGRLKDLSLENSGEERRILVAAKVLYFGVGGGIDEFSNRVKSEGGQVTEVWSHNTGVGRKILQISWEQ